MREKTLAAGPSFETTRRTCEAPSASIVTESCEVAMPQSVALFWVMHSNESGRALASRAASDAPRARAQSASWMERTDRSD
ncbi:MAG: hypothetical protein DCC71_24110 [Proteobacteria bacterium]|nr:MAG: hypothetical protein DCC71_24110 [Pseudomonadota bacterium]